MYDAIFCNVDCIMAVSHASTLSIVLLLLYCVLAVNHSWRWVPSLSKYSHLTDHIVEIGGTLSDSRIPLRGKQGTPHTKTNNRR